MRPSWILASGLLLAGTSFSWAQAQSHVMVVKAARRAFSPPLSQMAPLPPKSPGRNSDSDERTLRGSTPQERCQTRRFSSQRMRFLWSLQPLFPRIRNSIFSAWGAVSPITLSRLSFPTPMGPRGQPSLSSLLTTPLRSSTNPRQLALRPGSSGTPCGRLSEAPAPPVQISTKSPNSTSWQTAG